MFGIGIPELIIIFVIALIVLGPEKLPQLARQLARLMTELKKAAEDFKSQMDIEALKDIKHPKEMLKEALETKDAADNHDADWRPAHPRKPTDSAENQPLPSAHTDSIATPQDTKPETLPEKQGGEYTVSPTDSKTDVN